VPYGLERGVKPRLLMTSVTPIAAARSSETEQKEKQSGRNDYDVFSTALACAAEERARRSARWKLTSRRSSEL